jgi:hypothetical protein
MSATQEFGRFLHVGERGLQRKHPVSTTATMPGKAVAGVGTLQGM